MKQELLVISQMFYPELISTGQTLTELCEELSKNNIKVTVLCGQPTLTDQTTKIPHEIEHKNITIKRVFSTRFPKKKLLGKIINHITFTGSIALRLLLSRSKTPLLILTNPPFLAFFIAITKRINNRPLYYLIFDIYPETAISLGVISKYNPITLIWNLTNRFTFRTVTKIIPIGRCMESRLKSKIQNKHHHKINLIPIWGDDKGIMTKSITTPNLFTKKWALENKFVILYSGNFGRFHDIETILESAKTLRENQDILFLFVGDGYKHSVIQSFIKNNSNHNIQLHAYVAREVLPDLLHCADLGLVSLLPSQVGLSVPSKTLGLLAAGLPIIGILPPESEIALLINEEKCGTVITPGNSTALTKEILKFKNNPDEIKTLSANSKNAILNKYKLSYTAKKYINLIYK